MPILLVNRSKAAHKLFSATSSLSSASEAKLEKELSKIYGSVIESLAVKRLRNKSYLRSDLTVVFVDSPEAKKLNKEFRKKDYATDVLSFVGTEATDLGELIICPQVILRQCREHQLSSQEELTYMLIHGILHLLGYDHELSKSEEKLMFSIQDKIFYQLIEN